MPPRFLRRTLPWLEKEGVDVITGVHYDEVTASGVRITTKEGDQRLIPADTVMVLLPPVPNRHLFDSISAKVPEAHNIGGGNGVRTSLIVNAFEQAREVGCRV